jgi:hypothetical protein
MSQGINNFILKNTNKKFLTVNNLHNIYQIKLIIIF